VLSRFQPFPNNVLLFFDDKKNLHPAAGDAGAKYLFVSRQKNLPVSTAVGERAKESAGRRGPAIRAAAYQPGLYSTQSGELFETCLTGTNTNRQSRHLLAGRGINQDGVAKTHQLLRCSNCSSLRRT
jgi:hypothetical protein